MEKRLNQLLDGKNGKPIVYDYFYTANQQPKPVVIFSHGFKGFKDWGHFNYIGEQFVEAGFFFAKHNFSHNGTTPEQPADFADLEAFGRSTFSKEVDDLRSMIDQVVGDVSIKDEVDTDQVYLIGHSRGGGMTILAAGEDDRVKKIVTLASINKFGTYWSQDIMDQWKKDGVLYIENSRTKQQMPMYYDIYEDFYANQDRLDIPAAVKRLKIPFLAVHGKDDVVVPFARAEEMKAWNPNVEILAVEKGNHTFGAKHPHDGELDPLAQRVIDESIAFLKK